MIKRKMFRNPAIVSILVLVLSLGASAQTKIKPGMNFFSIEQDVDLGRHAAQEVEQQMPMLNDTEANAYIQDLGRKLARNTNLPDLPWQFKVVNSSDVNAFALPGGFVYVNRGLIEMSDTEGQLVGVLSHEISHVTLRHSTNQMSKAMVAQAPLSILGGLFGRGLIGQLAQLGIGVGANLAFMRFSRTAETQADVVGTQLMVRSGYDPNEMIHMFEHLEQLRKGQPSRMEQWFSSHPSPENRIGNINREISQMRPSGNLLRNNPRFDSIRSRLHSMPPAPKISPRQKPSGGPERRGRPEPPARNFVGFNHPQGYYSLSYPSNWKARESGFGAVLAPEGGIVQVGDQPQILYGALINISEIHGRYGSSRTPSLDEAVDELVDHLVHGNPYLNHVGDRRRSRLSGAEAIDVTLTGSRDRGETEAVWLIARWYDRNSLFYIIFIAPGEEFKSYEPTFREIARSLRIAE